MKFNKSSCNNDNKNKNNKKDIIEIKCPYCGNEVEKKKLNLHLEIHPSKVFDWLYVGGYNTATKKADLEKMNIKYILNCATECMNLFD